MKLLAIALVLVAIALLGRASVYGSWNGDTVSPDTRPRCEATVKRADYGWSIEEPAIREEPCGRLAKRAVTVGSRTVQLCRVHDRAFR